jgi:hypothetical protein
MAAEIRKINSILETIMIEGGKPVPNEGCVKVAVGAVIKNPCASKYVEDLSVFFDIGEELGNILTVEAKRLLRERPIESFGKGVIVGLDGELEHGAAILHMKTGISMRKQIGGGKAIVPSTAKRGPAGTMIDVPIHYKDAACCMTHFDTLEFVIPDAPRADEIVVVVAYGIGARPHARIPCLTKDQIEGEDRYAYSGGIVFTSRDEDGSSTTPY